MGGFRVFQGRIAPGHSPRCQRVTESLLETDVDREVPDHRLGAAGVRGVTGCAGVGGDGDPTATDAGIHLGEFIERDYAIPQELLKGKATVTIRFEPEKGHTAGPVFGVLIFRSK